MTKTNKNPFGEKGVRREVFDILRRRKKGATYGQLLETVLGQSKKRSKKAVAHKVRLVLSPALEQRYGYKLTRKLERKIGTQRTVIRYTLTGTRRKTTTTTTTARR
jgi:hypothetical protein